MRYKALFLAAALFGAQPAYAQVGQIKASVGTVAIERGAARLPAAPGQKLLPGDRLITGPNGRLSITFIDNTRMAIGPNSRIAVSRLDYDRTRQTGNFITSVERGSLSIVSGQIGKSKRDAMKVRTPTSLLGVRGTKFIVEVP